MKYSTGQNESRGDSPAFLLLRGFLPLPLRLYMGSIYTPLQYTASKYSIAPETRIFKGPWGLKA